MIFKQKIEAIMLPQPSSPIKNTYFGHKYCLVRLDHQANN